MCSDNRAEGLSTVESPSEAGSLSQFQEMGRFPVDGWHISHDLVSMSLRAPSLCAFVKQDSGRSTARFPAQVVKEYKSSTARFLMQFTCDEWITAGDRVCPASWVRRVIPAWACLHVHRRLLNAAWGLNEGEDFSIARTNSFMP